MSRRQLGFWMAAVLLGSGLPAAADPAPAERVRTIDAGVFLGGNLFTDDIELGNAIYSFPEQIPGSAFLLGIRAGMVVAPELLPSHSADPALGVELEAKLALSSTGSAESHGRDSYFAPVLGWRAHAILTGWRANKLSPFAVLGVGGETVFSDSPFMDSGDSDAALHWGVGANYRLAPNYGLRADLRHGITAGRDDLLASTVEIHLGFTYSFEISSKPARVGKKVHVNTPVAPVEPPAPRDLDQDGFTDDDDKCPKQPETFNDIDDTDGCPEIDEDGDGLLGSKDSCPQAAEDIDGYEDADGCPDNDNDNDGRPDSTDQCPAEPETLNGFEDDDGCPDEIPAKVAKFTGVMRGITFKSGSARITRRSQRVLDQTVKVLTDYPSIRLKVSGHTDDRGKRPLNMEISRKRADRVKWHLVDKGIDKDRIETEGFGPDKPLGSNKSAAGRRKNRRIEFELLPGPATLPDPSRADEPRAEGPKIIAPPERGAEPAPAPAPAKNE